MYARISPDHTESDGDHEAWLLTWLPGQATELHDHGGSAGAFAVVSGVLTEQVPAPGGAALVDLTLPAGSVRGFGSHHVHRIADVGTVPAVTVHVYAPALRTMTRYRLDDAGLRIAGQQRAGIDW